MAKRVLLAEDHQIVRAGLRRILEEIDGLEVIAEAGTGREAVDLAREQKPDLVVLDVNLPELNGVEVTRQILHAQPETPVVAVSASTQRRHILMALEAGAGSYVVKDDPEECLVEAVRAALIGRKYLSPSARHAIEGQYVPDDLQAMIQDSCPLSPRQREVLQMLAEGFNCPEIARRLHISTRTVEAHRRNISSTLGLQSIAELTKYAIQQGLTAPEP